MKINYSSYRDAVKHYKKIVNDYSEAYSKYLEELVNLRAMGLVSGAAAEELAYIISYLEQVKYIPQGLPELLDSTIEEFLQDVHEAQVVDGTSIFYDLNYSGLRDYSQEFFIDLSYKVENANYDQGFLNIVLDGLEDFFGGILEKLGKCDVSASKNLKRSQERLMQFKDITARRLLDIKNKITSYDETCSVRINKIAETLNSMTNFLSEIEGIFADYEKGITEVSAERKNQLDTLLYQMKSVYNEIKVTQQGNDEEVEAFITVDLNQYYSDENVQIVKDYIADLSGMGLDDFDFYKLIFFQMFNVAENEIKSRGDGDVLLMKNVILELLEEVSDSYSYDDSVINKGSDTLQKILGYIKKYGSAWKEYYEGDKRCKEYRDAVNFLNQIGDVSTILELGNEGIEFFVTIFKDYSRNAELLNSIERNYEAEGLMQSCFNEVRNLYEQEFVAAAREMWNLVMEKGISALYSISVGSVVKSIKKTIGFAGDITGENGRTAAQLEMLSCGYSSLDFAEKSFRTSVEKLKSIEKTNELYQTYVSDVKNCFSVYKVTLKRMFENMAKISTGGERNYYYYCAQEVSEMTLSEYGTSNIMTLEEYLASPMVW